MILSEEEREVLERNIAEADEVRQLKNQYLDRYFEDRELQLFNALKSIPLGNTDALNNLHHQLKATEALKLELQSAINSGVMANQTLDEAQK